MDSRIPLKDLTEAERRGAQIALDHVRRRGLQMERHGKSKQLRKAPKSERLTLVNAGRMVRGTAHALRRELSPDLKGHHYR